MNMRHVAIGLISALLCATLVTSARADRGGPPQPVSPAAALAQPGAGFAFKGMLRFNGAPVNGTCILYFDIYDSGTAGTAVYYAVAATVVTVTNGLFTAIIDPGWGVFDGQARWLETTSAGGGNGNCVTGGGVLSPRMALGPSPYAFALPGMRTVPGNLDNLSSPTMNVIGGIVSGDISNTISANSYNSVIGGGYRNLVSNASRGGAIAGGYSNVISGTSATGVIGGGQGNRIESDSHDSAIGGGSGNVAANSSDYSAIGGGSSNLIINASHNSAIGGGHSNRIDGGSDSAIDGGDFNVVDGSSVSAIGGGSSNHIDNGSNGSAIGGGNGNRIDNSSLNAAIGGGNSNRIDNSSSFGAISGGYGNVINDMSLWGAIGGGFNNHINSGSFSSTIGGGDSNIITGTSLNNVIGGGYANRIDRSSSFNAIGGGQANLIDSGSHNSVISGGDSNLISGSSNHSVIGGGAGNYVTSAIFATIPGGLSNRVEGDFGFAAGRLARALHNGAFVWADSAPVDFASTANDQFLVRASGGMGIGTRSPAALLHASSSGGDAMPQMRISQTSGGDYTRLRFTNDSISPSDGYNNRWDVVTISTTFSLYSGKYGENPLTLTPGDLTNYMTMGNNARLTAGGAWTNASDRNVKANFAAVDPATVLERLIDVPIQTWNYRAEDATVRHIGPMAQDFAQAFSVGQDDTHITTIDADGVALAAIQGLYRQNQDLKAQIKSLQDQATPPAGFRLFDLLSVVACAGFAIMWLQQRRTKRGKA